ncbi:MAG: hypothetical protein ABJV04_20195 [Aliiglaciecola sp.]
MSYRLGGWGDPYARDPQKILDDDATTILRDKLREQRGEIPLFNK